VAVVIDATAGGANANSYVTNAACDTYHESHPYSSAWDDASADEQNRALVTATRNLDLWFEWFGQVTTLTQRLLWPRRGVLKPGISDGQVSAVGPNDWDEPFGVLLDQDEIPQVIKDATCELARSLLVSDRTADSDVEAQGIESLRAGPVSIAFKGSVTAKPIPDAVMVMCTQVGRLRPKSGAGGVTIYRG
jgi:hypothetical protein